MAVFAINPPSTPIGSVSNNRVIVDPAWYRWFSRVQGVVGDDVVAQLQASPVLSYSTSSAFTNSKVLTAGAGIGFTSATTTFTIALTVTGVTAASYGSASQVGQFTVDAYGRITTAANVTITPAAIGAVPTTRDVIAGAGLTGGGTLAADRTFNVGAGTGITVNADDVALTIATAEGTFTPTLTNIANVASATVRQGSYTRMGSRVRGSFYIELTPTAAGATDFYLTKPVASNFANYYEARGAMTQNTVAGVAGIIKADAATDDLIGSIAVASGALLYLSCMYEYDVLS